MRFKLFREKEPASKELLFDCEKCGTKLGREKGYLACPECEWVPQHGSD